ncbi:MAG: aldo/keto reductase [Gammaproteobacteria bacterium]|nr:aldo/keto reductase [Gammaproteobacteria bacterium]
MITRQLGQTRQRVTAIGLGAMPLTMSGRPDSDTARQVIACFINGGGNFIDTANVYTEYAHGVGENEALVAATVSELGVAGKVVVATKGGLRRTRTGWDVDASPAWLNQSCDASLRALGMDCIMLYQLHAPDPDIDIRESVGAMKILQEAGKIRDIGLCNVGIEHIEAARSVVPVVTVQNALHPRRKKSLHNGVVDYCREADISFIAHSPVGGYHRYQQLHTDDELHGIARRHDTTPACISLAWLLRLGALPIPGARRCASVEASFSSMSLQLDDKDMAAINTLQDW